MISEMVVAYDGSKQSEKAYSFALEIAEKHSAHMLVLSVAQPSQPPVAVELEALLENATAYFEGHFKCLKELAESRGIEATFEVRAGHPAEQIVHVANEVKADVIVMGHRGESLLQRWLLGSVAKRVLSYAHCTVIVVR